MSDSFTDMLARLRLGDDAAAWEVFQRYARQLIARARLQFGARLRPKVDPEDVVQSVYRSFFRRCAEGEFQLDNWESLWSLLVVITLRKCANLRKYHQRERRTVEREVSAEGLRDDSAAAWEAVAPEPAPEEAALLTETLELALRDFDSPERQILELSLQGCTVQEIKDQLGRAERTVRRVRERFKHKLERQRAEQ